ncbi:MAG: pectate lyase [Armatimonadota bacterium]
MRQLAYTLACPLALAGAARADLADEARQALARATDYFTTEIACHGGYLWWYSEDLSERAGEGTATPTQIWIQPPGTPSVGFAYLRAYETTKDVRYLEAAKGAAEALIWGQLQSGGWDYRVDFDQRASRRWYYRRDVGRISAEEAAKRRNYSVFDDNTTQSALRLLMAVDEATEFQDPYHEAAIYGLDFMLRSQFDNGAWPQCFPLPKGYSSYYTFNDNAINDCVQVMLDAYHTYGKQEYLDSARKGGDFIILSQGQPPQAGWAQQYDHELKPAWARWFEPPAMCSAVTSRNIGTLLTLYLETGEDKYLEPIPAAVEWLDQSKIGDDEWARFYEPGTNKPLYVNLDREVVYEFVNIRPGYSWKGSYGVAGVVSRWQTITEMGRQRYLAQQNRQPSQRQRLARARGLEPQVRSIIESLDEKGRWLTDGKIETQTFITNLQRLSEYLGLLNAE